VTCRFGPGKNSFRCGNDGTYSLGETNGITKESALQWAAVRAIIRLKHKGVVKLFLFELGVRTEKPRAGHDWAGKESRCGAVTPELLPNADPHTMFVRLVATVQSAWDNREGTQIANRVPDGQTELLKQCSGPPRLLISCFPSASGRDCWRLLAPSIRQP